MSQENRCPGCGAELTDDTPQGLCPACLLKRGLESQTGFSGAGQASAADYVPPTPAELAPLFPDLEILELVGRGGMGVVYKARQKQLDRFVALKILSPKIGQDPAFSERFVREARAMARLSHPHIVAVFDFGQTKDLFYFLMEFVDGVNLRTLLDSGSLSPQQALAIVPQVCDALQYAHNSGIVHRDIKPENILLDKNGRVKIADFGLVKLVGQETRDFTLTAAGQIMGTPHYMAPEQFEHPQDVDHRADIYSLGVVFYQMLTGELPMGRFAPPSKKVQVDVRLDEVVLRALEKEPSLRYQQAGEIKTEVEGITTSHPTMAADATIERARQQVQAPAIGLLVLGILSSIIVLGGTIVLVSRGANVLVIPAVLLLLALTGLMIVAPLKMKRLESYELAVTASILAILASPSNLIGLAIGIWSLIVLSRSEVQSAFHRVKQIKPPRVPTTPAARAFGALGLLLSVVVIPLSLLGHSWRLAIVALMLGEAIALACGVIARRSHAGKAAIITSASLMLIGSLFIAALAWLAIRDETRIVEFPPGVSQQIENRPAAAPSNPPSQPVPTAVPLAPPTPAEQPDEPTTKPAKEDETIESQWLPVVERVVNDCRENPNDSMIDFESGRLFTVPKELLEKSAEAKSKGEAWVRSQGIDAGGVVMLAEKPRDNAAKGVASPANKIGLVGLDLFATHHEDTVPFWGYVYDSLLAAAKLKYRGPEEAKGDMTTSQEFPATFLFETREGGRGMLQVIGFREHPKGVKIRYKLLKGTSTEKKQTIAEKPATESAPKPKGSILVYEVVPDGHAFSQSDINDLAKVLARRIAPISEISVRRQRDGRPRIEIAVMDDKAATRVERLMKHSGTLEFRILANKVDHKAIVEQAQRDPSAKEVRDASKKLLAWWIPIRPGEAGNVSVPAVERNKGDSREVLVVNDPYAVTGQYLVRATVKQDNGQPCIEFELNDQGGLLFTSLTGDNLPDKNQRRRLGIILDGQLHSAPTIQSKIGARGQISGSFTKQEAADLVDVLNSGSLPLPLRLVEKKPAPTAEMKEIEKEKGSRGDAGAAEKKEKNK